MEEVVKCDRCEKLYEEIMGSFQVALEKMKSIAAEGKGQEFEAEHNKLYNRYFGCAIAMDTLLKEYYPEKIEVTTTPNPTAEEAPVDGAAN